MTEQLLGAMWRKLPYGETRDQAAARVSVAEDSERTHACTSGYNAQHSKSSKYFPVTRWAHLGNSVQRESVAEEVTDSNLKNKSWLFVRSSVQEGRRVLGGREAGNPTPDTSNASE